MSTIVVKSDTPSVPEALSLEAPTHVGAAPGGPRPLDTEVILDVRDLKAHFDLREGTVRAVDGVSYKLYRGRTLGIVGESGCGKSVTAQSVLRIVPRPGKIVGGEVIFNRRHRTGGGAGPLPAPVKRRYAPAGGDRHCPGLPAKHPHRRRADDGARRDDPGGDPRSLAGATRRVRHGHPDDYPQPGGNRRDGRRS